MAHTARKTIEELRNDQQALLIDRDALDRLVSGKRRGHWFRRVCGGIMPQ